MISQGFINACFTLCFNKNSKIKKSPNYYSDILHIIESWEKNLGSKNDAQMLQAETRLLKYALKELIKGGNLEDIIANVNFEGSAYESIREKLHIFINEKVNQDRFKEINKTLDTARKMSVVFEDIKDLKYLVELYDEGNFDTYEELTNDYTEKVQRLNLNLQKSLEKGLAFSDNSFYVKDGQFSGIEPVLQDMVETYDPSEKIPTGFKILDEVVLQGGFSKKGVYVFAGSAKSGKSTLLSNLFINSLEKPNKEKKVNVYITLENKLAQAIQRLYCPLLDVTPTQYINETKNSMALALQNMTNAMSIFPNNSFYKFEKSKSLSVDDLYNYLHVISNQLGCEIGAVYLDYLFHLKPPESKKDLRIQLGDITLELATLAQSFNIPIITASQLNRNNVKVNSPYELDVSNVAESSQISWNVDGLWLMAKDKRNPNVVHLNAGVQRNGQSDIGLTFEANFQKFKFEKLDYYKNEWSTDSNAHLDELPIIKSRPKIMNLSGEI